jgi:hypothetical protein
MPLCVCVSIRRKKSALLFDKVKHDVNMSTDEPIGEIRSGGAALRLRSLFRVWV